MARHEIKIQEVYADAVLSGDKTFEIRKNDRGYQTGDEVSFTVVDGSGIKVLTHKLNGKVYRITYLLHGWGLKDDWCVFSIKPVEDTVDMTVPVHTETYDYNSMLLPPTSPNQSEPVPVPMAVDPNTQCVDCPYGKLKETPDGLAKSILCGMYMTDTGEDIMRKPTDTCIADIVDTSRMTTNKED